MICALKFLMDISKIASFIPPHIGCTTFPCPPKMYESAFSPHTLAIVYTLRSGLLI